MDGQIADHGRVISFLLSALRGTGADRYSQAVFDYSNDMALRGVMVGEVADQELDWMLAEQLIDWFEASDCTAAGLARGAILVAAFTKYRPHARFKVAWKTLDIWRTRAPPLQAQAFTAGMAFASGVWCVSAGQLAVGTGIVVCFCALLRVSELLQLRGRDLLDTGMSFVVIIGIAKRGLEQKVVISHGRVVAFIRGYLELRRPKDDEIIFNVSYGKFQYWLTKAVAALGVPGRWTTHGLRRGGAT